MTLGVSVAANRGMFVRALGLETSLVRGKSPVPYLSGVTRVVGREGIEPPVSEDGWSTASCAPWRDRPMSKPGGAGFDDDVSAVVKVLMAGLAARRASGLGRCRTPGRRFWRPRRHHWLEPERNTNMTLHAWYVEAQNVRRGRSVGLPTHDGPAGIGKLPSSRRRLMIEVFAGCARKRAEARQGSTLERSFGGEHACHRTSDHHGSGR